MIKKAVRLLEQGRLVSFPTETVYGLGADADNPSAVEKVFSVKGRPRHHPLIVHIPDASHLDAWASHVSAEALLLAEHFWPGPLTLVLKRHRRVLDAVTGGQNSVALRAPAHPLAQALLKSFHGGLVGPSANRFGHISPTRPEHVRQELGNQVDLILEGGACTIGIESTIVDCTEPVLKILRPGIITQENIAAVLNQPVLMHGAKNSPRVSGQLKSHYAPNTPAQLIAPEQLEHVIKQQLHQQLSITVLARSKASIHDHRLVWITMPDSFKAYAQKLYAELRRADHQACSLILIENVPDTQEWHALHDRLQKACYTTAPDK